jgi:hypothetical protein
MRRLTKIMMTRAMYIEDMQLPAFIEEITAAINSSAKYQFKPSGLMSVWNQRGDRCFRTKIQGLSRRKRGQWAAFTKLHFEAIFLPHVPISVRKHKSSEDIEEDAYVGVDSTHSPAVRMDRFEKGLKHEITRTVLPNGTCCLAVSSTKRSSDRCVILSSH